MITIHSAHVCQRLEHQIDVVETAQRQEGELQDAEELETDYFAGEGREEESSVGSVLDSACNLF